MNIMMKMNGVIMMIIGIKVAMNHEFQREEVGDDLNENVLCMWKKNQRYRNLYGKVVNAF